MNYIKSLLIIVMLFLSNVTIAQDEGSILDKIDFNDTTMIDNDFMWTTLAEYITKAQHKNADSDKQMYNMILATDDILSRINSFAMYKAVYQYLISGFSELGANQVVDYMVRMPYLGYLELDINQYEEITNLAAAYERVKLGSKAPEIQTNTIDNIEITLSKIKANKTLVLFWSYSCPHCRDMLKDLGKMCSSHHDMAIVTVNVSGDLKDVKKLIKKSGLKNAYNICDGKGWSSPIVNDYAVDTTPSLFLLDENKTIIAKPFDIDELKKFLK